MTALPDDVDLGRLLNAIDAKALSGGADSLTEPERVLWLASCLFFEVDLGSFDGYYYNSAGGHAVEAAEALENIGAVATAAIVRHANGLFPGGQPARDREARYEQVEALRQNDPQALEAVSDAFYQRTGENIDALMEAYAAEHAEELPK